MVPEGSHVRAVYLTAETGVLAADLTSKLIIECSTIDAATFLHIRDQIHDNYPSTSFYDAPVSGGEIGAYKATLTVMLGCAEDDPNLPRLKDLLSKVGKSIYPCGGPSLGLITKQCNNYCSALITIANCEAFDIAMKSGMNPRVLNNILKTSTAGNRNAEVMNPVPGLSPDAPPSKGYRGGFRVQMMVKDMGLAIDQAKSVGANLALGEAGLGLYVAASEDPKCRDLDSKVVFRYLGGNEDWEKVRRENGK
jgi:3-hydroxyisobutyrate dehydrogenase